MKLAKPKYRGRLAKPITPGIITLAQYGSFDEWLKSDYPRKEFTDRMYDLLEHYQIGESEEGCWFALACELAADHIKGFTFAPSYKALGRPKKNKLKEMQIKKPPHRPTKHTLEKIVSTVNTIDKLKKEMKAQKNERISDRAALKHILTEYAKAKKLGVTRFLGKELEPAQKRLSRFRKKYPKSTI